MNRQQSLLGFEPWAPIEEVVVTPSRHGDDEDAITILRHREFFIQYQIDTQWWLAWRPEYTAELWADAWGD